MEELRISPQATSAESLLEKAEGLQLRRRDRPLRTRGCFGGSGYLFFSWVMKGSRRKPAPFSSTDLEDQR